ncbi:hypothetical protein [Streptomyces sp. NPDC060031]|uniref:hypothetical protein n=1 Tax=Streptomyces sp. NPDC060031 TaxID=3347043 RepID=UPI003698947C
MNRNIRITLLTPLLVPSLVFGYVSLMANSSNAATPSATCSAPKGDASTAPAISGQGWTPSTVLRIQVHGQNLGFPQSDANGNFSFTPASLIAGTITAQAVDQVADPVGPLVTCTTAGQNQNEQQQAKDQYSEGYLKGFNDIKGDCQKEPPTGSAGLDPNWKKGYSAGSAAATAQYC